MDILRRYLFLYTRHRRAYVLGGLFLIATNAVALAIPRVTGWAIDALEAGATRQLIVGYAAVIIALALFQTLMRVGSRIYVLSISRRIDYELKGMLHSHLLRLSPSFFGATNTGDLMSRMANDAQLVRALGGPGVLYFFNAVFIYGLGVAYMLSISWRLTLVVFVPLPIIAVFVRILAHRVKEFALASRVALSDLNTMVQENLSGVLVVKSFALESDQIDRFEDLSGAYMTWGLKEAWTRAQMIPAVGLGGGIATVTVLGMGGRLVAAGTLTIGDLVAFFSYIGVMIMPTVALGWILSLLQRGAAALERLDEILASPVTIETPAAARPLDAALDVSVKGLDFRYDDALVHYQGILDVEEGAIAGGRRHALLGVDFEAVAGSYVAVVGRVGSGKSTLLKALQHLIEVPVGTVKMGGVDVTEVALDELRRRVGYVPQDDFLFSTTVFDNIAYGRPDAGAAEVREVAEIAGLTADIDVLPDGLQSVVGERGSTLSGGQRQRVALARALLVDPDVLVLDNAMSNVDAETERRILDRLTTARRTSDARHRARRTSDARHRARRTSDARHRARRPGDARHRARRTLIVASNRLGAIQEANHIYVMEAGRIVDHGTHEELLGRPGLYAGMVEQQRLSEALEGL